VVSIAICDDDIHVSEDIYQQIKKFAKKASVSVEIEIFGDGRDIVADIVYGNRYDVIFMDIAMRHMDGLVAAQQIRKVDKEALLIYVTSYSQYAIEAYAVQPFQFLVKPYSAETLEQYFLDTLKKILEKDIYFRYFVNKKGYKLPMQDILYFESRGREVHIASKSGTYRFNTKLKNIERTLLDSKIEFWRIHQSYLVNRKHMYNISYNEVEMSDGAVLPISEGRRKMIRGKYFDYLGEGIIE